MIDLSADFRLRDPAVFLKAYGVPVPKPDLLPGAVYGLAEWHTDALKKADIIANPGCYPTATLLPLLPLARAGLLKGAVIVNAISGISGAGRKEKMDLLYVERSENVNAYNPGTSHRHAPEIAQELTAADNSLSLLFTPHMAPLRRGMAVTTVVELAREPAESGAGSVADLYERAYGGRPFIGLTGSRVPQTREVWGSNRCDIGWKREGRHLMLFSVIDNLVKGASGQAVQNMNIRFGIPETTGPAPGRGDVGCPRPAQSTVVVKIGGKAAEDRDSLAALCDEMKDLSHGQGLVLVHGGGAEVTAVSGVFGIEAVFKDGVRQTSPEEMDIVDMVLAGKVNSQLVRLLRARGLDAVGLNGSDGGTFTGEPLGGPGSPTRTGEVTQIDVRLLRLLLGAGYLPVLSSTSMDAEGNGLNINADTAAFRVAAHLQASALVFLSDIPGVISDGSVVQALSAAEATVPDRPGRDQRRDGAEGRAPPSTRWTRV